MLHILIRVYTTLVYDNFIVFIQSTTEGAGVATPKRAPLKNVNEQTDRVRTCYSPLAPVMMKAPIHSRKAQK